MRRTGVAAVLAVVLGACSTQPTGPTASGQTGAGATPGATPTATAPAASPTPAPTASPEPSVVDPEAATADPDRLGAALAAAEAAIRDPATPEAELADWAAVQQAAYRVLARQPEWRPAALTHVPAPLRPAVDANLAASGELSSLVEPREELPPWRIVAPPPAETLLSAYRTAAAEFGIDWTYLAAIHLVETRMGRIQGTSIAGAQGPMQFIPSTWAAYGEGDINDPHDAIRAAARYLAASGAPGDMDRALFAYNHSDLYVAAIQAYAGVMQADERAYRGYYHWQVYYRLASGDVLLEEGYEGPPA